LSIVRIILAVKRPLFADVLRRLFVGHDDLRVEAQVADEIGAAVALRKLLVHQEIPTDDPLVVITLIADREEIPPVCMRLIHEFPEVRVFCVDMDSGKVRSFRGSIQIRELQGSLENLVQELRSLVRHGDLEVGSS
jgi:hypothetical protein